MVAGGNTGGEIGGGGTSGASGTARGLTFLGPGKVMEGSARFHSSFGCRPS